MSTISPINSQSAYSAVVDAAAASGGEVDFSQLLKDALKDQYEQQAITMAPSFSGDGLTDVSSLSGLSSGGLEQMLLASAANGQADSTQMAIFMLMMMMQSGSGDMTPLVGLMSTLVSQLDTGGQKKAANTESAHAYTDTFDIESGVFSGLPTTQDVMRTGVGAIVPDQSWKAAQPAITGGVHSRSPQALRDIISQFDVENAERYRPFKNGATYCNIFVWDVTAALGCEIPHYIDEKTGEPREYPDVSGAWEMNANAICDWLENDGAGYGWREVTAEQAQIWANQGRPAVTAWKNEPGKSGHVQVVCPSEGGEFDPVRGVTVAQAGSRVTEYAYISSTFKQSDLKNVRYYIHD